MKPAHLQPGDTVAVLSPSKGLPAIFPSVYEEGLKNLTALGLEIKEYPTARQSIEYLAEHPEKRAEDINNALADSEVKAIISSIGGDDSIRILPFLDEKVITANPKIFMGYSDAATITTYLYAHGVTSFNGPSIMAGLSQMNSLPPEFCEHIRTFFFESPTNYRYQPYKQFSDGYPDWNKVENVGKLQPLQETDGWHWLQGKGAVQGKLFGGCIEVLDFLKGTQFYFPPEFFDNKILFLETSEEKPTLLQIERILRNYGVQGVFDRISALLFGRARDYSLKEKIELDQQILKVVRQEFGNMHVPIVSNMDFGHTDPQYIMPLGIEAKLDCDKQAFSLLESPTL